MKNIPPIVLALSFLYTHDLSGQTPQPGNPAIPAKHKNLCNYAGTYTRGPFIGQSNDFASDTIFLCLGDSIFIDHNGDQVFACTPYTTATAGIGWAYFRCPPTATCTDTAPFSTDPCFWPGAANGFWFYGYPSGDAWFKNNGPLGGDAPVFPLQIFFAPITLDGPKGLEAGSCASVNPEATFSIVYLNGINPAEVTATFGNDCIGKFTLRGGLPEWDNFTEYALDISLSGNAGLKALPNNLYNPLMPNHQVIFSVPEPGIYEVNVADGKSCSKTFQIDMSGCDATDNLLLSLPAVSAASGSTITLPLTITNGSIFKASFSVAWDTAVLQFSGLKNLHPALQDLALDMNDTKISGGQLGLTFSSFLPNPPGISIPNGETMLELEFAVAGPDGATTGVAINNSIAPVGASDIFGRYLAVSARNGRVDVVGPRLKQKPIPGFTVQLAPNVIPQGSSAALLTKFPMAHEVTVRLFDLTGRIALEHRIGAGASTGRLEIPTGQLPGGLYFVLCVDEKGQASPPAALIIQGKSTGF